MVRRLAVCFLLIQWLSGCLLATAPGMALVSIGTIVNTDKSPSDHFASWATGHDCSSVKLSKRKKYCVKPEKPGQHADDSRRGLNGQYAGTGAFCYRTLGEITCYSHPDPLASNQALVQ